ncbi:uncharacterized protein B4U80_12275, partial [Leptotrombidium deliense]
MADRHTAENMFQIIKQDIETFGYKKISALITDNAANMQSLRRIVNAEYKNIEVFGCAAHGYNLIFKDIIQIDFFKNVFDISKSIVKEVNDSSIKLAKFDELRKDQCNRLKFYVATRWYSLVNLLQSVLDAKNILGTMAFQKVIEQQTNVDAILEKHFQFWNNLEVTLNVLKPISKVIGEVEKDNSFISDIPVINNNLIAEITTLLDNNVLKTE